MTLEELHAELNHCQSLAECDFFLTDNLHRIRPLFYGLTKKKLQLVRFQYEDTFFSFINNSPSGKAIYGGNVPPASVIALLIFFLSLFERAALYNTVNAVANLIPPIYPLRKQCEAIFTYKNIYNSTTDYQGRFDYILELLQDSWENSSDVGQRLSENILREYVLDAFLAAASDNNIRSEISTLLSLTSTQYKYPIASKSLIERLLGVTETSIDNERNAVRSRIVEALHEQACDLVPESLHSKIAEDFSKRDVPSQQPERSFPADLSEQLKKMGAVFNPQRQGARRNDEGDAEWNRMYLGTYFPRTVIESRHITAELLSVPVISAAYRQKEIIRFLDVGSGTGAAIVGALLALTDWGEFDGIVEITSLDANKDALSKQREILESIQSNLSFELIIRSRHVRFPFDLDGFIEKFATFAKQENFQYDLIFFWKCLSEFYNVNFAQAQGIIHNTAKIASRMLVPYGLCVITDVTTKDNGFEFFSCTLNREINEHDIEVDAKTRTILPLPCGMGSTICTEKSCYTQRFFHINHQFAKNDKSKITYRILAPIGFAQSITASFHTSKAYCVNAAKPNQECSNGQKKIVVGEPTCGFTGFFT